MTKETITRNDEGNNYAQVEATSGRIKTLEQLLKAAKVNLKEWFVERHVINKWEVGAKHPETGEIIVEPLWQVKAWLARIKPIAIMPVVQPIKMRSKRRQGGGRPVADIESTLILPDPQFGFRRNMYGNELDPFHDRRALDVALQIAYREQPNRIVWLGDMLDLPDWSDRFLRSPEMYWSTQPAVIEAAWWLAQFRRVLPAAEIIVLQGNHDKRMEDALLTHLTAAYQLRPADELHLPPAMSLARLLAMDATGVDYVGGYPDGQVWLNDTVVCVHGDTARSAPGATAGNRVRNTDVTEIHGHIHRREWATRTVNGRRSRTIVEAFSPGCLCRIDGVVPGAKKTSNWQQGIAIVRHDKFSAYSITPIAIHEGRALAEGALYKARDRVADLVADTGWQF